MGQDLFKTTGEFTPDKLIADNAIPVTTKGIRVASGQGVLKRGTLLGAADDVYKVTGSKAADGDEESGNTVGCDCILADDVDTSDGDAVATAYVTGTFNRAAVITAEGTEAGTYETELRRLGIFLKGVQEY